MKKTILTIFAAISMLILVSSASFANLYSVGAENGKILNPTGISVDAGGLLNFNDQRKLSDYQLELGYGIFPAITISGAYEQEGNYERLLAKAFLSPVHGNEGYTLYAGYDLNNGQFAMVGASVWMNYKYLMAFINVESDVDRWNNRSSQVIPGFSFRLTPKFRIMGEAALDAVDLSAEELRGGVSYHLADRIAAKFMVKEHLGDQSDTVFQTGLSLEI